MTRVELVIELFEILEDFGHVAGGVDQVGDAEVIGAFLLSESWPWHRHDARLVNHLHAVDEVRGLSLLLGIVNELLWEVDLGEAIHGSFNLCARDLLHVVERIGQQLGALL